MYHYTDFNAFKGIVENKEFWLSSSLQMSDPLDRQHASLCLKRMVFDDNCDFFSELRESLSKDLINNIFAQNDAIPFYSASFCESENEYLWKKYAKEYTGIRICFEKNIFEEYMQNIKYDNELTMGFNLLNFREIKYGNGKEYIEKVGEDIKNLYDGDNKWYYWLELLIFIVAGTIKCKIYSEEREYRLLFKNIYSQQYIKSIPALYASFNKFQKYSNKSIMERLGLVNPIKDPKEHYALNFSDFFMANCISEITIGRNSSHDINEIETMLNKNNIKNVKVVKQG